MNRCRRSSFDPLAPTAEATWLVVRNEIREAIEVTPLERKVNLRTILSAAHEARVAEGWQADPIGRSCAFFFCAKDGARLMVGIERRDPANPTLGHGGRPPRTPRR